MSPAGQSSPCHHPHPPPPPLVDGLLVPPQGQVGAPLHAPAVVSGEEDDGVLVQPRHLQTLHDPPDCGVQSLARAE